MSDTENQQIEDDDGLVRRSTRRRESNKKTSTMSALERLKESRRSGKAHKVNVEEMYDDIYEEVDEETYNERARRNREADFVVDDDGGGYVDTGADIFDDEYDDAGGASKSKKDKSKKEPKKGKGNITSFFASQVVRTVERDESKVKLDDDDDDIMAMLADIKDDPDAYEEPTSFSGSGFNTSASANPFRKREREESPVLAPRPIKVARVSTSGAARPPSVTTRLAPAPIESFSILQKDDDDDFDSFPRASSSVRQGGKNTYKDEVEDRNSPEPVYDDFDDAPSPCAAPSPKAEEEKKVEIVPLAKKAVDPVPRSAKIEKPAVTEVKLEESWQSALESSSAAVGEDVKIEVVTGAEDFYVKREDGSTVVRMYFMDAFEDPHKATGTVYLFGRVNVKNKKSGSCCVVVKNVFRQVFFVPKDSYIDADGEEVPVSFPDLYQDVRESMKRKVNANELKVKKSTKKFMRDGSVSYDGSDCEVLEVLYPGNLDKLPVDFSGRTFASVHNTTTTALERLLVDCGFMGPGWIDLSNFTEATGRTSYCDYEFVVDMEHMKNIKCYKEMEIAEPAPLARMLALNVLTALNQKKEKEICMISMLYNDRCNMNQPSTDKSNMTPIALVTKPYNGALPFDFKNRVAANRATQNQILVAPNEKALLTVFLARMAKMEPDVILGHDLASVYALLSSRMGALKIVNWSQTSRLRRSVDLKKIGQSKAGQWELTAGRLLVDSKLAAKELVRCRSYELTELAAQILEATRTEIYPDQIPQMYSSSDALLKLVFQSYEDAWLAMRIIAQLNALPLALQITNIVGGVASRTLMGGRAERNEYLLLHAFHKRNVIAPNKHQPFAKKDAKTQDKKKKDAQDEDGQQQAEAAPVNPNKAQYSGGLVLDPKTDLYETLILLLDFNSLYPSIIQEYNICFTTVPHVKDGGDIPDVPQAGIERGILPNEIQGLVERRREVKKLLKDEKLEWKRKQYDIRQMALKLTANSMYGCLGFIHSRFYAKPLAALITSKGREILMHAKDLVEKMGYPVIYGDTDSIMVNTNGTDLQLAKKLGNEIKRTVSKSYTTLELELDGIFKRMLLLKKKKYAALVVNLDNETQTKKELKGLDIVRRDWSKLAKEAGNQVVDIILDPSKSREELVADIHDYLKAFRQKIDAGEFPLELFEISKELVRNPGDYTNAKAQSHVSVALRLNASGKFSLRAGDIIDYIICEDGSTNSPAQRAYHITEIRANEQLKIDVNYYLAQQVHTVVERLLRPIEETDAVRIAEALGMDSTGYRRAAAARAAAEADEDEYSWRRTVNYDHCEALTFNCPACKESVIIRAALANENGSSRLSFAACNSCGAELSKYAPYIVNQLQLLNIKAIEHHHTSGFSCDELNCEFKTNMILTKWNREGLECPQCTTGVMRRDNTSKALFDQQTFWRQIVNLPEALDKLKKEEQNMIMSSPAYKGVSALCVRLKELMDKYVTLNGYNRINLNLLFAPMKR